MLFDETTDSRRRSILNILIGECFSLIRKNPFSIKVIELAKTNSEKINFKILNILNIIFNKDTNKFRQVNLLLSDAAPYAIKVSVLLKSLIPNLKHITCICHGIHNLCETIRNTCFRTDKIISFMKRILIKNRQNKEKYKNYVLEKNSEFPILTRWEHGLNLEIIFSKILIKSKISFYHLNLMY
jgi:hypothetical protein